MVDLSRPVLLLLSSACWAGCPYLSESDLSSRLNADIDGDGVTMSVDCDDTDPEVTFHVFFLDEDGDGFGATAVQGCEQLAEWSIVGTDCDDSAADVFPGAPELCDGRDQDCDGEVDEDPSDGIRFFLDRDGDGHGAGQEMSGCDQPAGTATRDGDCDDEAGEVHPEADEVCGDGVDNDCSGEATGCHLEGEMDLGSAVLHVTGVTERDKLGGSVAFGGDLLGDGRQALVVGAPEENRIASRAGGVYILPGSQVGTSLADAADSIWIYGDEGSLDAGSAVAGGGDWNADGQVDLVVGASNKARVYLFFGPLIADSAVSEAGVVLETAERGTEAGASLALLGDVNADGVDDLLVGAPLYDASGNNNAGAAFLILGPITSATLGERDGAVLLGIDPAGHAGTSIALAGDTNGDGVPEMLVGAEGMEGAATRSGGAGLFQEPPGGVTHLDAADALILGLNKDDNLGVSVAGVGDLNGDGLDDVALGAPGWSSDLEERGRVYVLMGPLDATPDLLTAPATLTSTEAGARVGWALAGAGDVNEDGFADLWVGAPGLDGVGEEDAGATFLVLGPISGALALEEDATARIQGVLEGGESGTHIAAGQDADGDGVPDLWIGAPLEGSNGQWSGGAYLVLGIGE